MTGVGSAARLLVLPFLGGLMHLFDDAPEVPTAVLAVAFAAFFGFRLLAYCLAGKALGKAFDTKSTSAVAIAIVRVVLGLVGGYFFSKVIPYLPFPGEKDPILHTLLLLVTLFALRTFEWWITIALFFDKALAEPKRGWFCAVLGSIYSHFLDVPSWLVMMLVLKSVFWFGAV